jgi:hypothetical protein
MDKFIIKLFGVNYLNFWGWFVLGLVMIMAIVVLVVGSVVMMVFGEGRPDLMLLAAVAVALLGIFGVLLQIYTGLLAEKLEKRELERQEALARAAEREGPGAPERPGRRPAAPNVTTRDAGA